MWRLFRVISCLQLQHTVRCKGCAEACTQACAHSNWGTLLEYIANAVLAIAVHPCLDVLTALKWSTFTQGYGISGTFNLDRSLNSFGYGTLWMRKRSGNFFVAYGREMQSVTQRYLASSIRGSSTDA